jgi:hypothetical protein
MPWLIGGWKPVVGGLVALSRSAVARGAMLWAIKSWKLIIVGLAALPALAAAMGVIVKVWRSLVAWRDAPVLRFFQARARGCRLIANPARVYPLPPTVSEITGHVKRSTKSVHRSLMRLEHSQKLVETRNGWELQDYRLRF